MRRRCSIGLWSNSGGNFVCFIGSIKDTKTRVYHKEHRVAPIPVETERVATETIGAAIEVHRQLGPGFLENLVVNYKGTSIAGQRIDLVIASCVLVELKATVTLHVIQEVKVISYLRTTGLRLGLL